MKEKSQSHSEVLHKPDSLLLCPNPVQEDGPSGFSVQVKALSGWGVRRLEL